MPEEPNQSDKSFAPHAQAPPIARRLTPHDRMQVELKLTYPMPANLHAHRYRMEVFFFLPTSLNITEFTYPASAFYQDLVVYTRLRTPPIALPRLADQANTSSPLVQLRKLLGQFADPTDQQSLIRETLRTLKLLGCIFNSSTRESYNLCRQALYELNREGTNGQLALLHANALLTNVQAVQRCLRQLRHQAAEIQVPNCVMHEFDILCEYASLQAEGTLGKLCVSLNAVLRSGNSLPDMRHLFTTAKHLMVTEERYRHEQGYPSTLAPLTSATAKTHEVREAVASEQGELFAYRLSMLKKYVSSILHLEVKSDSGRARVQEVSYAIAAGLAMAMALGVTLFMTVRANLSVVSLQYVILAVLAYMLKDRVKAGLQSVFSRGIRRLFPDRTQYVYSEARQVGRSNETAMFVDPEKLDKTVQTLRTATSSMGTKGLQRPPETIFRYERDIKLDLSAMRHPLDTHQEIVEILRFNINRFLTFMDDPKRCLVVVVPEEEGLHLFKTPRVYHINVILRYTSLERHGASHSEKVRIVLNRQGIQRVETVASAAKSA